MTCLKVKITRRQANVSTVSHCWTTPTNNLLTLQPAVTSSLPTNGCRLSGVLLSLSADTAAKQNVEMSAVIQRRCAPRLEASPGADTVRRSQWSA